MNFYVIFTPVSKLKVKFKLRITGFLEVKKCNSQNTKTMNIQRAAGTKSIGGQ